MPAFLRDLRRRSKSSFNRQKSDGTDSSTSNSNNGNGNGNNSVPSMPTTKSSSTLNSSYGGATPPMSNSQSSSNLQTLNGIAPPPPIPPTRPPISSSSGNRHSVSGMSGLGSPSLKSSIPPSPYAPRILSIADNTWVYQKVLSMYGTIADPATQALEGNLTVSRLDDQLPPTYWPVSASHFKALIYLIPGPNRLRFDFTSPKLANSNTTNPIHSSYLTLHMLPRLCAPPLQLVILLAKDSPATFDAVPARIEQEGNGLETAIQKFRMAAYLWQAFTSEQMFRNKLGRRVFRMEEEWITGTANHRDRELGTMRSEAKVHVIRCSKTIAELRDLDLAQQNPKASRSGDLFAIASEAVKDHFKPVPGQKQYVSVLLLDSHWEKASQTITGHAALGGGGGEIQLAIFGSHALHTYPSSIEEVVPAFSDCTPTDTNYVANDCNESGSAWEAANIGIGAHMHETGHLFGCPHQENGVMLRDYVTLNRSFTTLEPYSTRTKSKGGLVLAKDECTWHRLDCLRFKGHPCFALPTDPPRLSDESVQVWLVDGGNVVVTAASGVAYLEIYTEGDDLCHVWQEFGDGNGNGPIQKQVILTEQELRGRLPADRRKSKLKLSIKSVAGGSHEVEDFSLLTSKASRLKLSNGQLAFRSSKLGFSQMEGSQSQEIIFSSAIQKTTLMTCVRVFHGFALDGIEFVYEDSTSQLFGKRGGQPGGSEFNLDTRRGEYITGFYVRSGLWLDGIAIMTSLGRKSPVFGNATGGSGSSLVPPRGYSIAGITGSCGQWVDGFGILITR
ncbi:putative zinc metalloproteinase [Lachnellula hyalina]|uniref:Putative zinc metalloproteinase n=1 Tax=Lachnellula hyalina TaxID=1316788 RepID=A0A8H8R163_9HELO|nr:putative zinc metalloproteinase [Lachnellula hyalina]TVY26453.1 putative zinc metalloproteinase [Lachnellula hyalina]